MNEPRDLTTALLERYQAKRAARPVVAAGDLDPRRRAYRQAAAVLHRFAPETLQPRGGRQAGENPRLILFADVERVTGEAGEPLFLLKSNIRRETLAQLRTPEKMREQLAANPARIMTPLQQMWEQYLQSGSLPNLQKLRYAELANVYQIIEWMQGLDDSLPKSADVLELTRQKGVFATFEHLVDAQFTGRTKELQRLRDYIGALATVPSGAAGIYQQLRNWISGNTKPPVAVSGPGGIGKTALIGRLLLDHAQADRQARIPFAYLAFDQPSLRIETPFTILVEAASQFEQQWPENAKDIEQFRKDVRAVREERSSLSDRIKIATSRAARLDTVQSLDEQLYTSFSHMLKSLGQRTIDGKTISIPVLLVLDTFEEVQYRDRESLAGFWRMLSSVLKQYPPFRVLICGRAFVDPAKSFKIDQITLGELSQEDRLILLQRMGVEDTALAQSIANQVGGNPLSLRLAANLVLSNPEAAGTAGITDLSTKRWLVFQTSEELIQGQLYRRILSHIHDENVAKLAHPGMVLRHVTPEIILNVLAPVCLPSVINLPEEDRPTEASRLFRELKRENSLVESGPDGALVYRPEIRRAMVRLLEQDRHAEVRAIRRAAIAFYSQQEGVEARKTAPRGVRDWSIRRRAQPRDRARPSPWAGLLFFKNADDEEWERNVTRTSRGTSRSIFEASHAFTSAARTHRPHARQSAVRSGSKGVHPQAPRVSVASRH